MGIDRYQDKKGRRHYVDGETDVLSVTTILNYLEEDTTGLEYWKRANDGRGDSADHRHLYWYKTVRGTLCHYHALKRFEEQFDENGGMWGNGEAEALNEIMRRNMDQKVIYSILKDHEYVDDWYDYREYYGGVTLMDLFTDDRDEFVDMFNDVCDKLGISRDAVICVEKFLIHENIGYGGQADLIYEDDDGNVVVADLKTSSSLRQKHRLQSIAYAKAVEEAEDIDVDSVDRVEVIRIHPETGEWTVHSNEDATEHHDTTHWYDDKYGNFEYEDEREMWEHFKRLSEKAHNQ